MTYENVSENPDTAPRTISFTVSDGQYVSNAVTRDISIMPMNDAPVAQDDSASTTDGVQVTIPVLVNDSDVDGDGLVIASVTAPALGTAEISDGNGDGIPDIVYTPTAAISPAPTTSNTQSTMAMVAPPPRW